MSRIKDLSFRLSLLIALVVGSMPLTVAHAQDRPDVTERATLAAFFDGVMSTQLSAHQVPGATVAVVDGGELVFAKGYGYADIATQTPVAADETLFRIGSVSKLFVWTAVMQLVEQGKLDLETDVRPYLADLGVAVSYDAPITLAHLMTHTAGFEDRAIGLFSRTPEDVLPLEQALQTNVPAQVRPPGQFSVYSNYGTTLAAYVVEQVAGVPYYQYVEENILTPLSMAHTTLRQPIPDGLLAHLAKGYKQRAGQYVEGEGEYVSLYPAGSIVSTATDMARFMLAYLNGGTLNGTQILRPQTVERMWQDHFAHAPQWDGMGLGFMERTRNGQRILHHGGDTIYFHSLLALIPQQGIGLFVSFNGMQGGAAVQDTIDAFIDEYFPVPAVRVEPTADQVDLTRFVGSYRTNRLSYTNWEKVAGLLQMANVSLTPEGELLLPGPGGVHRYVPVGPLLFQQVDGPERLLFRQNEAGEVTHLFVESIPVMGFEKMPWYGTFNFQLLLVGGALLLFLVTAIGWAISGLRNWRRPGRAPLVGAARWVAGVLGVLALVFTLGLALTLSDISQVVYGVPPTLQALLWLPPIMAVLAAASLIYAVLLWLRRAGGVWGRIHYTLVALMGVSFIWGLTYWHLLQIPGQGR